MSDEAPVATASQTVGPFFHFALTPVQVGLVADWIGDTEPISLRFRISDGDGQPVTDALVELWQPWGASSVFGRQATDEAGACEFEMLRPLRVAAAPASHINVCLMARGLLRQVHTRVYFAGDPALPQDPVLAIVPEDRRSTLLAHPDPERPGRWVFDVRLQGERETVFFNL